MGPYRGSQLSLRPIYSLYYTCEVNYVGRRFPAALMVNVRRNT